MGVGIRKKPDEDYFVLEDGVIISSGPESIRDPENIDDREEYRVDFVGTALIVKDKYKPAYQFVSRHNGNHTFKITAAKNNKFEYLLSSAWSEGAVYNNQKDFSDYVSLGGPREVLRLAARSLQGDRAMIITPGSGIAGYRIRKTLGLVRGNTIRARNIGRDIVAVFKNIVGGEIEEYTKMMAESREQSIDRMVAEAQSLGANAITDVRFATSYLMGSAAEILVTGNAVIVEALEKESEQ